MEVKMRRDDRALPEDETREILEKGEYGVLSTVSPDGQPYGVPVSYAVVGYEIYFHSAEEGHKLTNLATEVRVSFCVVGRAEVQPKSFGTKYESAIVFGRVHELTGEEKQKALVVLLQKYSGDYMETGMKYIATDGPKARVFKIAIQAISGKAKR